MPDWLSQQELVGLFAVGLVYLSMLMVVVLFHWRGFRLIQHIQPVSCGTFRQRKGGPYAQT
jgi:hypothetical protein